MNKREIKNNPQKQIKTKHKTITTFQNNLAAVMIKIFSNKSSSFGSSLHAHAKTRGDQRDELVLAMRT